MVDITPKSILRTNPNLMLKDVLSENLDVVFCGTAKGEASARLGYYYAGHSNKFYGILHKVGFTTHELSPNECFGINQFKVGLTDLVHTESGNDNQISKEAYEVEGFLIKMEIYKPKFIAFNGKTAASFVFGFRGVTSLVDYGLQNKKIGESRVLVLPSTSWNSRRYWDERYWFELFELCNS